MAMSVVAVVPARNEADVIGPIIGSLLAQDYPGDFRIILVDDQSSDGTAAAARALDGSDRLAVLTGAPAPGLDGQALGDDARQSPLPAPCAPDYLWLTDADIAPCAGQSAHAGGAGPRTAVVRFADGAAVTANPGGAFPDPGFRLLLRHALSFAWVNDPRKLAAAAAGGCVLARRDGAGAAGGMSGDPLRLIDDCALAA